MIQAMDTKNSPLGRFLTVRLDLTDHQAFHRKAREYGGASHVLRELVQAFIEGRLIVKPPVNPKKDLYHHE